MAFDVVELNEEEARMRFAAALSVARDEPAITSAVAVWAAPAAGAVFANTAILDTAESRVRAFHPDSLPAMIASRWTEFPLEAPTPLCEAILTGYPVLLPDIEAVDDRFPSLTADTIQSGLQATASFPLLGRDGARMGAMGFAWADPQVFSAQQLSRLALLAELTTQALERTATGPSRLSHAATRDSMLLQEALLPSRLPHCRGLDVAAAYLPANDAPMGGDWYDVFPVDDLTCLVIGDICGHGIEAAAVMAQVRHAIRVFADENPDPASVVTRVNRYLCRQKPELTATLIVAVWNPYDGVLRRCNAGHPPILRCRLDEYAFLELSGGPQLLIGADPHLQYRGEAKQLRPGTTLLFYTDGLVEHRGQHLDEGMSSLLAFARQHPNLSPQPLIDEILLWRLVQGPCPDDLGILAVRLT